MVSQSTASDRRAAANAANARKSTGPKTAEGKARSSRNALKHGIFCKQLLMPGEDGGQLREIRKDYYFTLKPQNALELAMVERIVQSHWRLARCERAEKTMLLRLVQQRDEELRQQIDEKERIIGLHDRERDWHIANETHQRLAAMKREVQRTPHPGELLLEFDGEVQRRLDLLNRYEQRLEYTVHRSLRDLDRLRQWAQRWADLPESDYTEQLDQPQPDDISEPATAEAAQAESEPQDVAECHTSVENEKRTHSSARSDPAHPTITPRTPGSEVDRSP
jgi:hypothetical protein